MANDSFLNAIAVVFLFFTLIAAPFPAQDSGSQIPNEDWDYVKVRENAFMFWWLYGAQTTDPSQRLDKPLIMWLQGGPGVSSTGYGNFEELGPLTVELKPRNTTWLRAANVLFVDNPVGAGFSYVTENSAFTTNEIEIANDLVTLFKAFLEKQPVFQQIPFYIFCESYGGKYTSVFGVALYQAIQAGIVKSNFRGVALGDSWISPVDSVLTYGPYLYGLSLLDDKDLELVNYAAQATAEACAKGQYMLALELSEVTDTIIQDLTDNVDVYNVLRHNVVSDVVQFQSPENTAGNSALNQLYARHVGRLYTSPLRELMNGPIRKKLGIIPDNVIFGGQWVDVYTHLEGEIMKPVISYVSKLLNYGLKVVIYEGQLDLICGTLGADRWIAKLDWDGLRGFQNTTIVPLYPPSGLKKRKTGAFYKAFRNLELYYIMKAGHMVPIDNGEMALEMVKRITNQDS